jgi:predicted GIY-YIG superfamily endonuclease
MKTTFIYSLSDPDTNEVRYIGKANNLKYRLWAHIHEAKHNLRNQHKCNWIKTLLDKDKKPVIDIIEEVSMDDWQAREIYWISQFTAWGFNLINKTKGGECGVISENCKKALSECKNRGHKKGEFNHSEETKALIREKRALQVITDEHRKNISKGSTRKIKIKEVTQSGEEIIWESLTDVAKQYNLSVPTICSYIKGRVKKQKTQSKFYYLK